MCGTCSMFVWPWGLLKWQPVSVFVICIHNGLSWFVWICFLFGYTMQASLVRRPQFFAHHWLPWESLGNECLSFHSPWGFVQLSDLLGHSWVRLKVSIIGINQQSQKVWKRLNYFPKGISGLTIQQSYSFIVDSPRLCLCATYFIRKILFQFSLNDLQNPQMVKKKNNC